MRCGQTAGGRRVAGGPLAAARDWRLRGAQVAETFTLKVDAAAELQELARLDTCVTVLDAAAFLDDLHAVESLQERAVAAAAAGQGGGGAEAVDAEDDRGVAELLMDQVEFADVIVCNKAELLQPLELGALRAALQVGGILPCSA